MKDFKNGKIYEIVCNKTGKRYVGSTAETRLSSRMACHRSQYKSWKEGRITKCCASGIILEVDDYEYHTIEHYECETKHALLMRESFWYHKYKELYGELCVNRQVPLHTVESRKKMQDICVKNWQAVNKDRVKAQHAKRRGMKVMCEYCNESTGKKGIRGHQRKCVANGGGLLHIKI